MKPAFLIIVSALLVVGSVSQNCVAMIENEGCEFYPKCLESMYNCGTSGYPIGYGFKYCSKFKAHFSEFPTEGQRWIEKTLLCLKRKLRPFLVESISCPELYKEAFESHPDCYHQSGFCELFNEFSVMKQTVKALLKVYEVKDFASLLSVKQVFKTARLCGKDFIERLMDTIRHILSYNRELH